MEEDMKPVVFELDDLCDNRDPWMYLTDLKDQIPDLRVTLFAIPGRCSRELLDKYIAEDWIELAVHGFYHSTYECFDWSPEEAESKILEALDWFRTTPEKSGFKAPGWIANGPTYQALQKLGMWVADHSEHDKMWEGFPISRRYLYNRTGDVNSVHGHTWNTCGNGPDWFVDELLDKHKDSEFITISEFFEAGFGKILPQSMLWKWWEEDGIKPDDLVIDVGAYKGEEAQACEALGFRCISFEPYPRFANLIKERFVDSKLVTVVQAAAWTKDGETMLYDQKTNWLDEGRSIIKGRMGSSGKGTMVKTVDLGAYIEENAPVKLLKLDTEGAEWEILEDLLDRDLLQHVEHIRIEDHADRIKKTKWVLQRDRAIEKLNDAGVIVKEWD